MCDLDNLQDEKTDLDNLNSDFDEDFDLMTGQPTKKKKNNHQDTVNESKSTDESEDEEISNVEEHSEFDDASSSVSEDEILEDDDISEASIDDENEIETEQENDSGEEKDEHDDKEFMENDGTWEDIYGRKRSKTGVVITVLSYISYYICF